MEEFGSVSFPHAVPPAYSKHHLPRAKPRRELHRASRESTPASPVQATTPVPPPKRSRCFRVPTPILHSKDRGTSVPTGPGADSCTQWAGSVPGCSPEPPPAPRERRGGGREDLLEESCDVLPAAAGPGEWGRVIQELWRHDERSFPNWLTVIAASIMLNPKTV